MNEPEPIPPGSSGLDPKIGGLVSYAVPPVSGIVMFILEKQDEVIRWHAAQSIVFGVAWVALWVAYWVLSTLIATLIPILGFLLSVFLWVVLFIGGFVIWVVCLVKGYSGEKWRMPLFAQFAEQVGASEPTAG